MTPIYFSSLTLENVKCFLKRQKLSFMNKKGEPARWTVIIGNNNLGKTTILQSLANLEPVLGEPWKKSGSKSGGFFVYPSALDRYGENYSAKNLWSYQLVKLEEEKWTFNDRWPSILDFATLFSIGGTLCFFSGGEINYSAYTYFNPDKTNPDKILFRQDGLILTNDEFLQKHGEIENKEGIRPINLIGYSANRKINHAALSANGRIGSSQTEHLFNSETKLLNIESWLLQLDYASKSGNSTAKEQLDKAKHLLTSSIFPELVEIDFETSDSNNPFVKVKVGNGWVRLRDLGYGYQASMSWIGDLAKRMFDRYPDSPNPFHEAAVVLVDELDLHLHPEWQRKIISYLSGQFPNIQWIVTAHSPLIVQSADEVNLVLLEKDGEGVSIRQPQINSYQGWSVEEILQELMGMGERTHSDRFLALMESFDQGLNEGNYEMAKSSYEELMELLHPSSIHRRILTMQFEGMVPAS